MGGDWIPLGDESDLCAAEVTVAQVGKTNIAVFCAEQQLFAIEDLCTHGQARLSEGYLEGCEIECPLHQGRFDLRTGRALCAPLTKDIRTFELRVEGGLVLLKYNSD